MTVIAQTDPRETSRRCRARGRYAFHAVSRSHHGNQDRFLELNATDEPLVFSAINGPVPNRGLAMHDINMFGLTCMQQISERSTGAGLHTQPGIWASVPKTTPRGADSVVRMASIPHGTVTPWKVPVSPRRPGA